jgi:hypothetical protein
MAGVLALLRRRWLLALAGLLLTMAACLNVVSHGQPSYRASSQMLFLLPPTSTDPTQPPVNPYLNLQGGMGTMANLISGMVTTKDVQLELAARGLTAQYTVVYLSQIGPVLQIEATHTDPLVAARTRDAVMDLVDADLAALQQQADTPTNQVMKATRPTVSKDPTVLNGAVYQGAAMTAVAGFLLVLLLCFVVDRRLRRRSRQAARAEPVQAGTVAKTISRIGRDSRPPAAEEADEPDEPDEPGKPDQADQAVVTSQQGSGDHPLSALDERTHEHPAGDRLHEPETADQQDEPAQDIGQLVLPLEPSGSADAAEVDTKTAKAPSSPTVRVPGPSRRYRNRMAKRTARAAATEVEAPERSGQARADSLAG